MFGIRLVFLFLRCILGDQLEVTPHFSCSLGNVAFAYSQKMFAPFGTKSHQFFWDQSSTERRVGNESFLEIFSKNIPKEQVGKKKIDPFIREAKKKEPGVDEI